MGQPLIRIEIVAEGEGMSVRLAIAPSVLTQVYARDGLGLFDRSSANIAVELRDNRTDAEEYASKFRAGSAFELGPCP